jgi:hypothetical protein
MLDCAPVRALTLVLALAGCGGAPERCTAMATCPRGGTYRFCTEGSAAYYKMSDGSRHECASDTDCTQALMDAAAWCMTN